MAASGHRSGKPSCKHPDAMPWSGGPPALPVRPRPTRGRAGRRSIATRPPPLEAAAGNLTDATEDVPSKCVTTGEGGADPTSGSGLRALTDRVAALAGLLERRGGDPYLRR